MSLPYLLRIISQKNALPKQLDPNKSLGGLLLGKNYSKNAHTIG